LACEIAVEAKAKQTNLHELLIACYKKYGAYKERLISISKPGKSGLEEINTLMDGFRRNNPKTISGIKVITVEDYLTGISKTLSTQQETKIDLPKANVLLFKLEEGTQIALRPSGTEPKIKYYFSVNQKFNSNQNWEQQESAMDARLDNFETSFKAL
ncbi:phospho-sugar mutase, partial [Flavobacteriaceae bacterium]|nr:phospho-sugar mutase [Flavobacteriaceae bacterium]